MYILYIIYIMICIHMNIITMAALQIPPMEQEEQYSP